MMYGVAAQRFKSSIRGVGATGLVVPIMDYTVPRGECNIYTRVIVENETSANSVVRILVKRAASDILAHYFASFAADVPQILTNIELNVEEGEQLRIEFSGTTDADVLAVYLWGYTYAPNLAR